MKQTVCLLGGHLSPAQATAEALKAFSPDTSILFIGRSHTFTAYNQKAVELRVMSAFGEVVAIDPPRSILPWTIPIFLLSVTKVLLLYLSRRPACVVCFGSYVAIPGVIAAIILRIPIVVHEQTRSILGVNTYAARFAKAVCITDGDVDTSDITAPISITGFPLRPSLFEESLGAAFPVPMGFPIIVVTGGTTGAVSINDLLFPLLTDLLQKYTVIHQTGDISYEKALRIKKDLPSDIQDRYIIEPYISSTSMNWLYKNAALFIGRSGANTVHELAAFEQNAILIPLPWSKKDEQDRLADWYVSHHQGVSLKQQTLTSATLFTAIQQQVSIPHKGSNNTVPHDGAKKLVDCIMSTIHARS